MERSACIFCNIANKLEDTELLYEDDEVCVFRDIKPATRFHVLTIPKVHIEDVKQLNSSHKDLGTMTLWPPFRSVRHLHLHGIAPESEMGYFSRLVFMKNSYWFVSPDYIEDMLEEQQ